MDIVMKKIERLAEAARRRPESPYAPGGVMARIDGLHPDRAAGEHSALFLFELAAAATAAAAIVAVGAFFAWNDLHNPFLALQTLGNVLERL